MTTVNLYPNGDISNTTGCTLVGAATFYEAVDDPADTPDDISTYAAFATATSGDVHHFICSFEDMPTDVETISQVAVNIRSAKQGGGGTHIYHRPFLYLNGNYHYGDYVGAQTSSWTDGSYVWYANPETGTLWSPAGVNGIQAGVDQQADITDDGGCTQCYITVTHNTYPNGLDPVRDMLSRRLRLLRHPLPLITINLPLVYADVELLDLVGLEHYAYPDTGGEGAGANKRDWERATMVVLGSEIDLDSLTVKLTCTDAKSFLTSFWDTGISTEAPSPRGQGIARLNTGGARSFTRGSNAWVENAAAAARGGREVIQIGDDVEKLTTYGELVEAASTQYQLYSSFADGLTGWTVSGTSEGGSITTSTDALFSDTASTNSLLLTGGTGAAHLQAVSTGSEIPADTIVTVSIDHKDGSASDQVHYALLRTATTEYWDDTNETWGAAAVWNAMDGSTDIARHMSNAFSIGTTGDLGSTGTAYSLYLAVTTSGTTGQTNHVYHAQVEGSRYATSRMVTSTSAFARAADNGPTQQSDADRPRSWPAGHGTARIAIRPEWGSSALSTDAEMAVFDVTASSSGDWDRLYYDAGTCSFVFERSIGGSVSQATYQQSITAENTYKLAARWTSSAAEQNLAAWTISVFCASSSETLSKGTDATPGAACPLSTDMDLRIGHRYIGGAPTNHMDACFKHADVTPFVLSDTEVGDYTP